MKFWIAIRTDVDIEGRPRNKKIIKASANKKKFDTFVKSWEEEWKHNTEKVNPVEDHSWLYCDGKLEIQQHFLEDITV